MTDVKPMLAKDGDPSTLSYPVIVQPKLDGIRAMVVNGKLLSRTLKPIPNAEIQSVLGSPAYNGLDGEIIVGDVTADDAYRKTSSFVMAPNKTGEDWRFFVFDRWDSPYGTIDRLLSVCEYRNSRIEYGGMHMYTVPNVPHGTGKVVGLGGLTINDEAALEAYEARMIGYGHEGIIVRTYNDPYKFGRSGKKGPLLKIKRFVDFEAEVIGVYEEMHNANEAVKNALGRTERSTAKAGKVGKGRLGGLVLRAINGPAKGVTFRCGTGFNQEQRIRLWAEYDDGNDLIGQTGKIKSFPIGVKDKPRHPVFLGFRDMEIDG